MRKGWERANQLQKRISDFKKRIIRLSSVLPRTKNGQHVSNQIFKSGTSVSANYAEARSAESEDDFIHKLKLARKELGETADWLETIESAGMINPKRLVAIRDENDQLCRILTATLNTLRRNLKS
mgnify:CR=1 FL=1